MPAHNPTSGNAPGLPAVLPRRSFLAALAPLGALAVASPAIARTMTREEQIEHHKSALFRLYAETVPEGTELQNFMMDYSPRGEFYQMNARRPDQLGHKDPWWHFASPRNEWEYCEVRA
ncbi:hypothetical protein SAMN05877809_104320 [Rhodobacter sp. JA431]|uniref:hypothetical protein n=1 Tax=Rhodobacter sp. JA431 TaxID=570013 RepID=UPI000BCFE8FC|nr:hypothetical protein [Rhodobacter sp. JA431]SOC08532.1 hypothetical protein SAMN05877809_104320 [Rhodobacter sp. JA431]